MRPDRSIVISLAGAAFLSPPVVTQAQETALMLKAGVYVADSSPCRGAPNAQILTWDGVGLSGAHSSQCVTRVQRQDGIRYQISTTCSALGDGSKNEGATPREDLLTLRRISNTRFVLFERSHRTAAYRWCSKKVLD